jgi:hypothetical protein
MIDWTARNNIAITNPVRARDFAPDPSMAAFCVQIRSKLTLHEEVRVRQSTILWTTTSRSRRAGEYCAAFSCAAQGVRREE